MPSLYATDSSPLLGARLECDHNDTMPTSLLKLLRQIHLYIGLFIAPALLFFALTGALQTFSLHESTQGSDYKPPAWIVSLSQLHKHQTATIPVRKPRPANAEKPRADKPEKADISATAETPAKPADAASITAPPPAPSPKPKSHLPMKIFFLLVSLGLFTSTLTGIYMAYKYNRSKLLVTGLLLAGILIPLALLPF
jgi:hypothetical protein